MFLQAGRARVTGYNVPALFANLGSTEILLIAFLALLFGGPKFLPELATFLGKTIREIRKMTADIKSEIELDESIRKPLQELREATSLPGEELKRLDFIRAERARREKEDAEAAAKAAEEKAKRIEAGETGDDPDLDVDTPDDHPHYEDDHGDWRDGTYHADEDTKEGAGSPATEPVVAEPAAQTAADTTTKTAAAQGLTASPPPGAVARPAGRQVSLPPPPSTAQTASDSPSSDSPSSDKPKEAEPDGA